MEVILQNQSEKVLFKIQAKKYWLKVYQKRRTDKGDIRKWDFQSDVEYKNGESIEKRKQTGREREKGICDDI